MRANGNRLYLLIAASLLTGILGCPGLLPLDGLLTGTWQVVPDEGFNGPLTTLFITFDATDQLSHVSYTFENGMTLTWRNPDGSTELAGDTIHVTCTVGGNGFTFDGTLDSTTRPTSADGTLSLNLELGNLSVSMPQGPATLVKQ
jgi:hypothetical protein